MGAAVQEITFTDVDGEKITETWYFQLDESDAAEMDLIHELLKMGNPEQYLRDIVENHDSRALLNLWRDLLLASVGKRKGKLIIKGPEIVEEFRYGGAYRAFFSELITKDDAGASFFVKIMPENIQQQVSEEVSRTYTDEELLAMTWPEFYKAAGTEKIEEMDKRFIPVAFKRKTGGSQAA